MMKLVENGSGLGELIKDGRTLRQVRYQVQRYQGIMEGSGLPIPGLFRLEGSIDFDPARDPSDWINTPLTLRLVFNCLPNPNPIKSQLSFLTN